MSSEKINTQSIRKIGIPLLSTSVTRELEIIAKENGFKLFEIASQNPVSLKPAEWIDQLNRNYFIESSEYGMYLITTSQDSGPFDEDGEQPFSSSSLIIKKIDRKDSLENLDNIQSEAEMSFSSEQDWKSVGEVDRIIGDSTLCTITGEDKFLKIFENKLKRVL